MILINQASDQKAEWHTILNSNLATRTSKLRR